MDVGIHKYGYTCMHEYKKVAASNASQVKEGVWDGRSDKNAPEPCFHHNRVQQFL